MTEIFTGNVDRFVPFLFFYPTMIVKLLLYIFIEKARDIIYKDVC